MNGPAQLAESTTSAIVRSFVIKRTHGDAAHARNAKLAQVKFASDVRQA